MEAKGCICNVGLIATYPPGAKTFCPEHGIEVKPKGLTNLALLSGIVDFYQMKFGDDWKYYFQDTVKIIVETKS